MVSVYLNKAVGADAFSLANYANLVRGFTFLTLFLAIYFDLALSDRAFIFLLAVPFWLYACLLLI
jgi:hypothetical protein